jgi:hypothetical protein
VEQAIDARGLEWTVRADAREIEALGNAAAATA